MYDENKAPVLLGTKQKVAQWVGWVREEGRKVYQEGGREVGGSDALVLLHSVS